MGFGRDGEGCSGPMVGFDLRSKVAFLVAVNAVLLLSTSIVLELFLIAASCALVGMGGRPRQARGFLLVFLLLLAVELALVPLVEGFWGGIVMFAAVLVRKILPVLAVGLWIASTTEVSEFLVVAEAVRLPRSATIPLSVAFRYFPTLKDEWTAIRDAMRMRGVGMSVEHVLVPIMMSAVGVSDELSAAALCRGIDCPNGRTCLREVRLACADVALMAFSAAMVVAVFSFKVGGIL